MFISTLKSLWQEEDGQDMVEYALLLAFVALGAVTVLGTVKTSMTSMWSTVSSQLNTAQGNASAGH